MDGPRGSGLASTNGDFVPAGHELARPGSALQSSSVAEQQNSIAAAGAAAFQSKLQQVSPIAMAISF